MLGVRRSTWETPTIADITGANGADHEGEPQPVNVAAIILSLKGEPAYRGAAQWRYGGRGASGRFQISPHTGDWVDWGVGRGSLVDLVVRERRCTLAEARQWLDTFHFVPETAEQRAARLKAEEARREALRGPARKEARVLLDAGADLYRREPSLTKYHPYLKAKGLEHIDPAAYGLSVIGKSTIGRWLGTGLHPGNILLVPVRDINSALHSLQGIDPAGNKRYLIGGPTADCLYLIGDDGELGTVYIAEGIATAISIHEATGKPVAVCFSAYNMRSVAITLAERSARVILCADDDWAKPLEKDRDGKPKQNVGLVTGRKVLRELRRRWPDVGHALALPEFYGVERGPNDTDFNDVMRKCGSTAVREIIDRALEVPNGEAPRDKAPPKLIPATVLPFRDPASIPRRAWLYRKHYIRRFVSATLGNGGTGKTGFVLCEAVDMAAEHGLNVWY